MTNLNTSMALTISYPQLSLDEARAFLVEEYGVHYANHLLCDSGFDPRAIGTIILHQLDGLGWKFMQSNPCRVITFS